MNYYSVSELASMLKVHPETIKREVGRNKLKCFKVGTELRFTQEHVDNYTNVTVTGKTTRELELEKELANLKESLEQKEKFIGLLKTELIKL